MNNKKYFLISIIFIALVILINNKSYAGTQYLNSLDYNVILNSNGDMNVVETWDIDISETNTLFKDFDLDSRKYSGITDVKVEDLTSGKELVQIDEEMYHVTKDCYYGLKTDYDTFEIAWGVGLDNCSDTREYQISYTVKDAVTNYKDCSELYWMFLSNSNGIPVDKVTGLIKLPKSVSDIEKLRVWAHGPLNGEIWKESRDTVIFNVDNLDSQTMLEVRIVTEENVYPFARRNDDSYDKLESILAEEKEWADEANKKRMISKMIFYGLIIGDIAIVLFFATKIKKYITEFISIEKVEIEDNVGKYFRDIPNEEKASPAQAAFLFYSKDNSFGIEKHYSKVFSATLLELCIKKCISFDKVGNDFVINFLKNKENIKELDLTKTEKRIFGFLHRMKRKSEDSIKMSEIKDFAKKNYDDFNREIGSLVGDAKRENIELENYDVDKQLASDKFRSKAVIYGVSIVFTLFFGGVISILYLLPVLIEWLICIIILNKTSKKIHVLTEKGEIERLQWKGLRNYMKDFSLLKEREVPELVLWERYLVYATAFGIAEEVIKQLKVVYPEINNINNNNFYYMPFVVNSNFSNGFINELNSGIDSAYKAYQSAYNSAHSSSGSGGGGGFSSGGGGRRWRWPEWVEDKNMAMQY